MPSRNTNLIFDIGTSEGNDTAYYLRKGFKVVGLEADPITYESYATRFASEIQTGDLQAVHAAAGSKAGETVTFYRNDRDQGLSSLTRSPKSRYLETQTEYEVQTTDYVDLAKISGIPHYCKVDIEGGEAAFLQGLPQDLTPEYISVEMKNFSLAESLFGLGYRKFKLVDQNITRSFEIPNPPLEGNYVEKPDWSHTSGPFGRELPGPWITFSELCLGWEAAQRLRSYRTAGWTWFDCHAWKS
jgi:FkbM family methyltransferase